MVKWSDFVKKSGINDPGGWAMAPIGQTMTYVPRTYGPSATDPVAGRRMVTLDDASDARSGGWTLDRKPGDNPPGYVPPRPGEDNSAKTGPVGEFLDNSADKIREGLGWAGQKLWGGIGALAGGVRGALDHGPSLSWNWINEKRKPPEGRWSDYVRAGWNAGNANADRLAAGMLSGIVPSDSVRQMKDQVYADDAGPDGTQSEYRVTDWNEKSRMKRMSELGGNATSLAASTWALGKVLPAGFRLIGKGVDRLASGAKAKKVLDFASKAVKPTLAGGAAYSGYNQMSGSNEYADAASADVERAYEETGASKLVDAAVKDPSSIPPALWDFLIGGVDRLPPRVIPQVMKAYSEWQKSPKRLYAHVLDKNDRRFMDKGQINGVIRSWNSIPYENRMEFMREMINNRSMLDEETVSALRALTM